MSRKAKEIYEAALAIMNEQDIDNGYKNRSPAIINSLMPRCWQVTEEYVGGSRNGWTAIDSLEDEIVGFDDTIVLSVMPYGLAAALYVGEDALQANSWQQIYEQNLFEARRIPQDIERIEDVYGCVNPCSYGRW